MVLKERLENSYFDLEEVADDFEEKDSAPLVGTTKDLLFEELRKFTYFTSGQEIIVFEYYAKEVEIISGHSCSENDQKNLKKAIKENLEKLYSDPRFVEETPQKNQEKMKNAFLESKSVKHFITTCNLGLVAKYARQFQGRGLEFMELFQEGCFGVFRAIEKFDPSLGNKFSTYATWWIIQAMDRAIKDTASLVRMPVNFQEALYSARKVANEFKNRTGRTPEPFELQSLLEKEGFSEQEIKTRIKTYYKPQINVISLDKEFAPIDHEDSTIEDFLQDPNQNIEDDTLEDLTFCEICCEIERILLEKLGERSSEIVRLRFGLDDGQKKTLDEVGQKFGITKERVRQIEANAKRYLRWANFMEARFLLTPGWEYFCQMMGPLVDCKYDKWCYQIAQNILKDPEVYNQLSPKEKCILTVCFLQGGRQLQKSRIGQIFSVYGGRLDELVDNSLKRAVSLYAKNIIASQEQKEINKLAWYVADLKKAGFTEVQIGFLLRIPNLLVERVIRHLQRFDQLG